MKRKLADRLREALRDAHAPYAVLWGDETAHAVVEEIVPPGVMVKHSPDGKFNEDEWGKGHGIQEVYYVAGDRIYCRSRARADFNTLPKRLKQELNHAQARFAILVEDPARNDEIVQNALAGIGVAVKFKSNADLMDKDASYTYCIGAEPDVSIGKDWQVFRVMRGGAIHVFDVPERVVAKIKTPVH